MLNRRNIYILAICRTVDVATASCRVRSVDAHRNITVNVQSSKRNDRIMWSCPGFSIFPVNSSMFACKTKYLLKIYKSKMEIITWERGHSLMLLRRLSFLSSCSWAPALWLLLSGSLLNSPWVWTKIRFRERNTHMLWPEVIKSERTEAFRPIEFGRTVSIGTADCWIPSNR